MDVDDLRKRESLIAAVEAGRLTPSDAEQQSLEAGLGPLLPPDRPEDFNPSTQERWTLLMAVVWVLARNITAVRNSWNDFIVSQYRWVPTVPVPMSISTSFRPERRKPQWLSQLPRDLRAEQVFRELPGHSFDASMTLLRHALANDTVGGWARDLRPGSDTDVDRIPAANWHALQLVERTSKPLSLASVYEVAEVPEDMLRFDGGPVYTCILVSRADLLEVFPEGAAPVEDTTGSRDPVAKVADLNETPAEYKRRIRLEAIRTAFPTGKPPSMKIKARDKKLDDAVKAVDADIGLADPREWRRLWSEVHHELR